MVPSGAMTEPQNTRFDTSEERLIAKEANAQKLKSTGLLKNGFKLNLRKKNGYKTVLSKSNEDLSTHNLILNNTDDNNGVQNQSGRETDRDSLKASPLASPTTDAWFHTWPERVEKVKTADSSPEKSNKQNGNSAVDPNGVNSKLTLNEALKNISLAYSPVTRKLHIVEDLPTNQKTTESQDNNTDCESNFRNKLGAGGDCTTAKVITASKATKLLKSKPRCKFAGRLLSSQCLWP